jgi:cardiolipin synthase
MKKITCAVNAHRCELNHLKARTVMPMSLDASIWILTVALLGMELMGIVAAVHAIMNARTAQSAIAWSISLVTFPWLALILYVIFGRNKFQGYVSLRSMKDEALQHVVDGCCQEAFEKKIARRELTTFETVLTRLAALPITRFNKCSLLVNGDNTFRSIFDSIECAKDYVLVQFYLVQDDSLGRELKARLIQKAEAGVDVYFLYDEIGSFQLPASFLEEMRHAGIWVSSFHTTKGKTNHFQLNFRNHRKIIVVDGTVAYSGGHNVGDEYVSRHARFGPWRDTHVRMEGPVVKLVQYCFVQDWYWATSNIPALSWELMRAEKGDEETLVMASGPSDSMETCSLMFIHAIQSAKERFWIASPYFVPDVQILNAMKLAVLKGVDVRILIPEKPDHRTIHLASFAYYENTIPFGIRLYRYKEGFMHQKVFLVDSSVAAVGTVNLDNRSFHLNFEFTLLNFDAYFIKSVEAMLKEDFSHSRLVTLAEFSRRPFYFKLASRSARLLAPVL